MDCRGLFAPLELPCGAVLKSRIVKSAMSDSLGDGRGNPTPIQMRLYERWAHGGVAASIIGEVQGSPCFPEKPGNLVLNSDCNMDAFKTLAKRGSVKGTLLWLQLGHAGAMAYPPVSTPKGPSDLAIAGLKSRALTSAEIAALPGQFAHTASLAEQLGFGGVQIHAAHGFLLSQFLSPLFNRRDDKYGGSIRNRTRLLEEVIEAVRSAVSARFPVAVKLNATDQLEGGLMEEDALAVVSALDRQGIDLVEISGGTYFPGAKSVSDAAGNGPYFIEFLKRARTRTNKPLMITGGVKTRQQAEQAFAAGADLIGLARALALDPELPRRWQFVNDGDPVFPKFTSPPEGAVTAWYTMRLAQIGRDAALDEFDLAGAMKAYEARDRRREEIWNAHYQRQAATNRSREPFA